EDDGRRLRREVRRPRGKRCWAVDVRRWGGEEAFLGEEGGEGGESEAVAGIAEEVAPGGGPVGGRSVRAAAGAWERDRRFFTFAISRHRRTRSRSGAPGSSRPGRRARDRCVPRAAAGRPGAGGTPERSPARAPWGRGRRPGGKPF